jgi:hypothetical protein
MPSSFTLEGELKEEATADLWSRSCAALSAAHLEQLTPAFSLELAPEGSDTNLKAKPAFDAWFTPRGHRFDPFHSGDVAAGVGIASEFEDDDEVSRPAFNLMFLCSSSLSAYSLSGRFAVTSNHLKQRSSPHAHIQRASYRGRHSHDSHPISRSRYLWWILRWLFSTSDVVTAPNH